MRESDAALAYKTHGFVTLRSQGIELPTATLRAGCDGQTDREGPEAIDTFGHS